VAALGVDAIWLSPFYTSPLCDGGYDVADHCAVDPRFGTLEDFDALLVRAHDLGLKVMVDQVFNHTSDTHPWFRSSRTGDDPDTRDLYVWADAKPDNPPASAKQRNLALANPDWTESRARRAAARYFLGGQS
jgi:alpha-glucosidase